MARNVDVAARRKMRALEAKRDTLMETASRTKVQLAEARAALKAMRTKRRSRNA